MIIKIISLTLIGSLSALALYYNNYEPMIKNNSNKVVSPKDISKTKNDHSQKEEKKLPQEKSLPKSIKPKKKEEIKPASRKKSRQFKELFEKDLEFIELT